MDQLLNVEWHRNLITNNDDVEGANLYQKALTKFADPVFGKRPLVVTRSKKIRQFCCPLCKSKNWDLLAEAKPKYVDETVTYARYRNYKSGNL